MNRAKILARLGCSCAGWVRAIGWPVGVALAVVMGAAEVRADQLTAEQHDDENGYIAFEELSYEAILEASDDYATTLRLRVALNNSSQSGRDVVQSLALPFAARLTEVRVAKDGNWTQGVISHVAADGDRRDPGTVYVRSISPASRTDIPGAEIVAFGLEPGTTTQVEVVVRVFPRLRGARWELDLPARGVGSLALASERRVVVTGLSKAEQFWVDDAGSGTAKFVTTRAEDMVTVAWPAKLRSSKQVIEAQFETSAGPGGFDDGTFRLYLRLGQDAALRPEHVIVLIDRSLSAPKSMDEDTLRMLGGLFDALPAETTFDALAFNRRVLPLLDDTKTAKRVSDIASRRELAQRLAAMDPGQGTDLGNALAEAARRAKQHRGKTLIVVATDGMFPSQVLPADIRAAFEAEVSPRRRPEVLLVIDEPMLQRSGIAPSHPVARVAAALGARISLESLASMSTEKAAELLQAPSVLSDLAVSLPKGAELIDPLPQGLVAGSFAVLRGRFVGKTPKVASVSGRQGAKTLRRQVQAVDEPAEPEALAAAITSDPQEAALEGFATPPWYQPGHRREAKRGITQAGRAGRQARGFLDQKIFRYYLKTRVLPRAHACYNRSLTRFPAQDGRVLLEMEVGKGEVMLAQTKESDLGTQDPRLIECMTEAAWALDIPAGKMDDQIYRLRYPLKLIAPEEGKIGGSVMQLSDEVMETLLGQPLPSGSGP